MGGSKICSTTAEIDIIANHVAGLLNAPMTKLHMPFHKTRENVHYLIRRLGEFPNYLPSLIKFNSAVINSSLFL